MNLRITVLLVIAALTLSACLQNATAMRAVENTNRDLAASGSPYRIKAKEFDGGGVVMTKELAGTPAATLADEQLKSDVLKVITDSERKLSPNAALKFLKSDGSRQHRIRLLKYGSSQGTTRRFRISLI